MQQYALVDPLPPIAVGLIGIVLLGGTILATGWAKRRLSASISLPRGVWIVVGGLLFAPIALVLAILWPAPALVVDGESLTVRAALYGATLSREQIVTDEVSVISLTPSEDRSPESRISASNLPGSLVGWCRLRNGERSLVYIGKERRAVYIPTTEGFSLLLEVESAEELVRLLRVS